MTTSKLVETLQFQKFRNLNIIEERKYPKKVDLTASRRCDETWVPGRGMQITIISQC